MEFRLIHTCPDCGAILSEDSSCQAIFESFLVLEFKNPVYGKVHMLTVACFMIQHERYSDEALIWIERKLRDYLEGGIPVEQLRLQAAKEANQATRAWRVLRRPDAPPLPKIVWTMTIADVASNYKDATSYRGWVIQWASRTLQEMQPLLPNS